jgi:hypothetical protein
MVSYPAKTGGGSSTERDVTGTNEGFPTLVGIKVCGEICMQMCRNVSHKSHRVMSSMSVERRPTRQERDTMVSNQVYVCLLASAEQV